MADGRYADVVPGVYPQRGRIGYLFGPWMDVTFHVILISGSSVVATASRINTLRSRQVITPEPAPLTPLETGTHSSRLPETVG